MRSELILLTNEMWTDYKTKLSSAGKKTMRKKVIWYKPWQLILKKHSRF